jgi:circadian clock protein KaiB
LNKFVLKLYIAGSTPHSQRVADHFHRFCEHELPNQCEYSIVDVLEHPEVAEQDGVLATPALVRWFPPPARRIIGDFCNPYRVLDELRIWPAR